MPVALATLAVSLGSWVVPVAEPWVEGTGLLSLLLFLPLRDVPRRTTGGRA